MVPMRGVDHEFVPQGRVVAWHHTCHVELFDGAYRTAQGALQRKVQGHGPKVATLGQHPERVKRLAALLDQGPGGVFGHPALQGRLLQSICQEEAFGVPTVANHRPTIAGGSRGVDKQHPRGAVLRGQLELGGPATVFAQMRAVEEAGFLGGGCGLVHQHQQHLAMHVQALVIVPLVLGGVDAEAHEDHRGVEGLLGSGDTGSKDNLRTEPRRGTGAASQETEGALIHPRPQASQGHGLAIGHALGGLQTQHLELSLEVAHGEIGSALARAPALQQVVRQESQVSPQRGLHDFGHGIPRLGQEVDHDQDGQQETHGDSARSPQLSSQAGDNFWSPLSRIRVLASAPARTARPPAGPRGW